MKRSLIAGLALVAMTVAGNAWAQSPWTGCYGGLNAGGVWANSKFTWTNINEGAGGFAAGAGTVLPAAANSRMDTSGVIGGGQVGCNFEVGAPAAWGMVLGFEGDFGYTGLDTSRSVVSLGNTNGGPATIVPGQIHESFSSHWLSTIRGRVGVPVWDGSLLLYGTGGLAIADARFGDQVCFPTAAVPSCNTGSRSNAQTGWTGGGGAEWSLNPQWSIKAEYLHVDLGSAKSYTTFATSTLTGVVGTAATIMHNHDITEDIARIGVNFHFNPPPPPPPPMPAVAAPPPPPAQKVFLVFFDWDRDTVTPEGMAIIQQAADAFRAGAPVRIMVTGYTDRSGSPGYNQRLSERRANNVANALTRMGVPRDQMAVSGRGENDNRVPTADGVREPQNRRVEIVF